MAKFEVKVPSKNIVDAYGEFGKDKVDSLNKKIASVKSLYGNIIKQVSDNSNVPEELIISMIIALSNGVNNTGFRTSDRLIRSGLFSLSNKTAKQILAREMAEKRMSPQEIDYLERADPKVGSYLSKEKGGKSFNFHWSADYGVGLDRIKDEVNKFLLTNPKTSIQIGTIWLGQLWDTFSLQTSNPLDKVIITAMLPYNDKGWLSGNELLRGKSWNEDYTSREQIDKLPKPATDKAESNIINPDKGWVGESLKDILNKNGLLYNLTKK